MGISLRTNVASIQANTSLNKTNDRLSKSMQKLSSGLRINRAGDDAAGLAISEKFQADLRSLQQLKRNANDGISLIQVAEGALSEVSGILIRMRELAAQGATDTVSAEQKQFLQKEIEELKAEVTRIGRTATFNGITLLSGAYRGGATGTGAGGPLTFQVGLTGEADQQISVALATMSASALSIADLAVTQSSSARAALGLIDAAILNLNADRAVLGSAQNRLQVTINNMSTQFSNLSAANSRIRDVDVAEETATMSRNQILMQSGVSVLAQANQIPQLALSLLQG